jgi:hypothetical protein
MRQVVVLVPPIGNRKMRAVFCALRSGRHALDRQDAGARFGTAVESSRGSRRHPQKPMTGISKEGRSMDALRSRAGPTRALMTIPFVSWYMRPGERGASGFGR